MNTLRGKLLSLITQPPRVSMRFTLPLLLVLLLLFSAGMLGMGYLKAREQGIAGASAYIRQLEAFAALQEKYARQWIEGSVMPILRALEDAGPERYYAYESQRQRLESAIMAAMPAGQGQMGIRVYLEDKRWHGTRFSRGTAPARFTPGEDEIRRLLLAVAEEAGVWQTCVEQKPGKNGETEKTLAAQYCVPVFKRSPQGLRSRFGVLAVDVSFSWLASRIRAVSTTPDAHIFFMDRDGAWTLPEPSTPGGNSGLPELYRLMSAKQTGQSLVTWKGQPQVAAYMPLGSGDLMLGIFIPQEELFGSLDRLAVLFAIAALGLFLFALLSLRRTAELILRPLRELSREAERLSTGDFSHGQPAAAATGAPAPFSLFGGNPRWPDEPGRLRNVSAQLRVALRQRQKDLTLLAATRERLFGEIALAGKLQHNLRRGVAKVPQNILLAAEIYPAGHIAQDILDHFTQNRDTLCLVAASATAHGVPAALLMDRVMPLLHELLLSGASPAEALKNANIILHSYTPIDKTEISAFVSVFIGAISADTGVLTWAGAGKNPPYRVFAGRAEALPWSGDLPLGVKPDADYQNHTLALRPGETLFLCGGRLLAMPSPTGSVFGEERLKLLLQAFTGTPAKLLETVRSACLEHTQSETPPEDIAVLAARWLGGRQP